MAETLRNPTYLLLRSSMRVAALVVTLLVVAGFFLPSDYIIRRSQSVTPDQIESIVQVWVDDSLWHQWMPLPEGSSVRATALQDRFEVLDGAGAIRQSIQVVDLSHDEFHFIVQPASDSSSIDNKLFLDARGDTLELVWEIRGELSVGFLGPYLALVADSIAGDNLVKGLSVLVTQDWRG